MLGWPQEAGFAFSSKNIQPLTSLDVLYSNSWSPSLSMLQPVSSWAQSSAQSSAWQLSVSWNTPAALIKFPTLWAAVQPCSWKSTQCCSTWPELLQNTPLAACGPRRDCCPAEDGQGSSQRSHSTSSLGGTDSSEQEAELGTKGLHKTQVQTLSTILSALLERRNHSCTHHSHLGITHMWQQLRGGQQLSA